MSIHSERLERCQAVAIPGLEEVTAGELTELGVTRTTVSYGSVGFSSTLTTAFRANLWVRSAVRIRLRLARFHAPDARRLSHGIDRIDWAPYIAPRTGVGVHAALRASALNSRDLVERIVRERIAARLGMPPVSTAPPSARVDVRIARDRCTLSLDMSGERLDRRGYRLEIGKAPLREHLAAAILLRAGWRGETPLVDAMCGSGTLPIEAARLACALPPSLPRAYAFQEWPCFDAAAWAAAYGAVERQARADAAVIIGADLNAGAIGIARRNAARAGVDADIHFVRSSLADLRAALEEALARQPPGLLVMNPPLGKRFHDRSALSHLYAEIGGVLRAQWHGWRVATIASAGFEHHLGLPLTDEPEFRHGGLRCRLACTGPL